MSDRTNNPIYRTVVVAWLTLSIASVALVITTWIDLARRLDEAKRAIAVRSDLDGILRHLIGAESAQRAFTITGNQDYLQFLSEAEAHLPAAFDRLTELLHEVPLLLKVVTELRTQAVLGLHHQRTVVETRKGQGFEAASERMEDPAAQELMGHLRARLRALRHAQTDFISEPAANARSQLMRAGVTGLVAGIVGIGTGVYAFRLARIMLAQQARERQLVEEKLRAERSNREKSAFLANMSHEIRTPMNAILGFSELLANELQEPKHRQYVHAMRLSAGSLLQLINDILDMSKIEAGVLQMHPEPTDPREICDFLYAVFSEASAKKGVKFECSIAEDLPRSLLMDRSRLRQVLVNLVGNAMKFTDRGSIQVRVRSTSRTGDGRIDLLIEVEDTGVGIPQDKLEVVFEPFVQSGTAPQKERAGTGLGLSIVKRLIEVAGGSVTASSVLGIGSVFTIRIPDVPVSARLPLKANALTNGDVDFSHLQPATILVADDNEANCQLLAGILEGTHHRSIVASSGPDALEKAQAIRPDIILLDIRMPGMDGRETLAELRKIPGLEQVPVIAVTASNLEGDALELREKFSGFVRKPFTRQELYQELSQFIPARSPSDIAPPPGGSALGARHGGAPVSPDLLKELRRLQKEFWPDIRDSLAINESRSFATGLANLCRRWPCPSLAAYARELTVHADNYSVMELEHHLLQFGRLIDLLEKEAGA